MPNISSIVTAISNDVVAKLATAGYPPLTDGRILMGRQHDAESSAPPRIIMTPVSSDFTEKRVTSRSNVNTGSPRQYSTEQLAENAQRSIGTEVIVFEVRAWGTATPPNADQDFDITQALYQQVIASVHLLTAGSYGLSKGQWTDSKGAGATQLVRFGREFVFGISFQTPVLDQLLSFAPTNVKANPTTYLQPLDGSSPEVGCTGT
jgi:hypothetical protein